VHVGFGFDVCGFCFLDEFGIGLRVFHVEFACESHSYDGRAFETVE